MTRELIGYTREVRGYTLRPGLSNEHLCYVHEDGKQLTLSHLCEAYPPREHTFVAGRLPRSAADLVTLGTCSRCRKRAEATPVVPREPAEPSRAVSLSSHEYLQIRPSGDDGYDRTVRVGFVSRIDGTPTTEARKIRLEDLYRALTAVRENPELHS